MSQKGSAFERETCTKFSLWWSSGKEDDVFWRTAGSGARATTRFKRGKLTASQDGDMQAVDERGKPFTSKFTVEIKRGYGRWSVMDVLDKADKMKLQTFDRFIAQAKMAADRKGTIPLLVAKRDQRKIIIAMPVEAYMHFAEKSGAGKCQWLRLRRQDQSWYVFTLDDFFSWIDPETLKC